MSNPAPYQTADPVELPRELDGLVAELADRFLSATLARAYNPATYRGDRRDPNAHENADPVGDARTVAILDARAILHALRSRLDELAPEVVELRAALVEANRKRDEAWRDAVHLGRVRDELLVALRDERRLLAAERTDALLSDARRRTVATYLRRDADAVVPCSSGARECVERMRWAADMLDAEGREGVAL